MKIIHPRHRPVSDHEISCGDGTLGEDLQTLAAGSKQYYIWPANDIVPGVSVLLTMEIVNFPRIVAHGTKFEKIIVAL